MCSKMKKILAAGVVCYVAYKLGKKYLKENNPEGYESIKKIVPDIIIFDYNEQLNCSIFELKDGNVFDTKKSEGELFHLKGVSDYFNSIGINSKFFVCGFNANSTADIYHGLKKRLNITQCITGKDFCKLYGSDYKRIRTKQFCCGIECF